MWTISEHAVTAENIQLAVGSLAALYLTWKFLVSVTKRDINAHVHRPKSTLPLLGNTLDIMLYHQDRFMDYLKEETEASGGKAWILSIAGRPPTFVVTSPDGYEDICKNQVNIFEKGPDIGFILKDFLGEGIICVDGHKWLTQRRMAAHLFSNTMMSTVMTNVVREKSAKLASVLAECRKQHKQVSMKSLISKFTSDVFTKIGFGVELNGLDIHVDVDTQHPFIEAIHSMTHILQSRFNQPTWLWRLKRFLDVGEEHKAKQDMKVIHELLDKIIHESLANHSKQPDDEVKNLISLFVQSGNTDVSQLRDFAMNFFFAGKDTTSFSFSWFIVEMNRHPEVAQKIRQEIQKHVPELITGELDTPSIEDLSKLTYLEAAIRENLRLNTSLTNRYVNQDTTLSDGTFIPKGANVIIPHYAAARMKYVWGEDAEEYKPERWIDPDTGKLQQFSPYKFVTFLAGPRQCIGMKFAMLELKTVLATLMSRFDIKTVEDPFTLTYELSVVFPVKGPLMVTVEHPPPIGAAA